MVGVRRPGSGTLRMIQGPAQAPAHEMRPTIMFEATAPCQILSTASLAVPGSRPVECVVCRGRNNVENPLGAAGFPRRPGCVTVCVFVSHF